MPARVSIAIGLIAIPLLVLAGRTPDESGHWIATDGDTVASPSGERIRLLYIDAPEMPSSSRNCRRVHCPAGDPHAAKAALQRALDSGIVTCEGAEQDRYGRRLAECFVTAPGIEQRVSINEWMLSTGTVERYRRTQ